MSDLKSLVIRAQAGDLDAYSRIVVRFQDMAYGYGHSLLGDFHRAEDAAQERRGSLARAQAFVEAYRTLSKLRQPAAFPGWFRRIVFKQCDRFRRRAGIPTTAIEAAADVAHSMPGPAQDAERREMRDRVLEAIKRLPKDERAVTAERRRAPPG